jgi:membrane fusion protein, multidrug efflux system
MRKNIIWLLLVGIIAASCGSSKKDSEGTLNDKKAELQKLKTEQAALNGKIESLEMEIAKLDPKSATATAKLVNVTALSIGNFSHYIDLQGRIDATNISYVAPPNGQGGVVKALYVSQGQSVRKGQVIARLDDQLIRQQMEPLRVQLATAEDTYNRTKNLWDQGVGAYQNVLNAKTQVDALKKQIGIIQKQASLMTVTAPASGVIDQLNLRVGEIFTGMSAMGAQIRIVNTGDLKVVVSIPENYLSRVSVGSKLKVVLPDQNNRELDAVVTVVQKIINPNTRAFDVEAKIPSDPNLKPNQIAQVKILDYASNNVIIVPLNVVQTDDKGKYVFVMEKDKDRTIARKKTVTIGESYGDVIEIKSGLQPGEQLITEGYQGLYQGQVIKAAVK